MDTDILNFEEEKYRIDTNVNVSTRKGESERLLYENHNKDEELSAVCAMGSSNCPWEVEVAPRLFFRIYNRPNIFHCFMQFLFFGFKYYEREEVDDK